MSTNVEKEVEVFLKYRDIFPKAWERFLKKIGEGKIFVPVNEAELRCHLFSECLSIMQELELPIPHQIFTEVELSDNRRVDLALGFFEDEKGRLGRLVAIELKHFPVDLGIVSDLTKLGEYVKEKSVIYCFFATIGRPEYINEQILDLTKLGLEKSGMHSFYKWRTLNPPFQDKLLETLIVGFLSSE